MIPGQSQALKVNHEFNPRPNFFSQIFILRQFHEKIFFTFFQKLNLWNCHRRGLSYLYSYTFSESVGINRIDLPCDTFTKCEVIFIWTFLAQKNCKITRKELTLNIKSPSKAPNFDIDPTNPRPKLFTKIRSRALQIWTILGKARAGPKLGPITIFDW